MFVARHSFRVATLSSIAVFIQGSVHSHVRYVAKHSLSMPHSQYTDGSTQARDLTSVSGVSMSLSVRLFSQLTKSHAKLKALTDLI
jgi:hypothetical protein